MWFYRRILRIPYTAHVKNEVVLDRMSEKRELINIIRSQQMKLFLEHTMRNMDVENIIVTEMIEGRRDRGTQRLTFTKRLSNLMVIGGE